MAQPALTLEICGPSGCSTLENSPIANRLLPSVEPGASVDARSPPIGEYYDLKISFGRGRPVAAWLVTSHDVLRTDFLSGRLHWVRLSPGTARELEAETGVKPWPTPALTRALVGDGQATEPQAYVNLYDRFPEAPFPSSWPNTISIFLNSARPSPWTDGYLYAEYAPGRRLLFHDGRWFRVPAPLAAQIERDAGLAPTGAAWPGYATTVAFAGLIVVILWLNRRARQRSRARAT